MDSIVLPIRLDRFLRAVGQRAHVIGWTVLVAVLLLLLIRHWPLGPKFASDFRSFDVWSDYMIEDGFRIDDWFARFSRPERLYLVPMTLMAFLKVSVGETWQYVWFWLNLLCTGLAVLMLCSAARMLKVSWLAIAAILPVLLVSADFMYWPHYLLTDSLYAFLIMAGVWWSVFMLTRVDASLLQRGVQIGVAVVLLILVLFGRPTSLTYTLAFLVFFLALALRVDRLRPWQQALGFVVVFSLLTIGYATLIHVYTNTDWMGRSLEIGFLARFATEGMIVWDRPDMAITHAGDWLGFAQVYVVRFVTYWSPYASTFSIAHLLANTAITLVFAATVLTWLLLGRTLSPDASRAVLLTLLIAFAGAAFHGMLFIDYDWRYRFPVIAPLLLFAMVMLNHAGQILLPPRWHGAQA